MDEVDWPDWDDDGIKAFDDEEAFVDDDDDDDDDGADEAVADDADERYRLAARTTWLGPSWTWASKLLHVSSLRAWSSSISCRSCIFLGLTMISLSRPLLED